MRRTRTLARKGRRLAAIAASDPHEASRAVRSFVRHHAREVNKHVSRRTRPPGTHVMSEAWDTLVLLDACRYDLFAARNTLDGRLERRYSLGSSSLEFLQANFRGREHHDTVYVTANPYVEYVEDGTFHAVVNLLTEWDPVDETVRPETVAEHARRAHETYPNKRLIVHFMQPHYPFLGDHGRAISHRGYNENMADPTLDGANVWETLREGRSGADIHAVRKAYAENLDIVLDHLETLLPYLDGRTVVSADHGNLVGERGWPVPVRGYGHTEGYHTNALVEVPWLVRDPGRRRKTTADPPREPASLDEALVERRLAALGYR